MKLTETEISQRLKETDGWDLDSDVLKKVLTFKDFATTVSFVSSIVPLADGMNHHPDIRIYGWNKLEITVTTHDAGGLTPLDFELIYKIDNLLKDVTHV